MEQNNIDKENNSIAQIDDKDDLLEQSREFFLYYKNIRSIANFGYNQPIDYYLNPILYFNVLINIVFEIILDEKPEKDINSILKINFLKSKLLQINSIGILIEKIIKQLEKKEVSEDINEIIKPLLFSIDGEFLYNHITFGENLIFHNDENKVLTKDYLVNFISNNLNILGKIRKKIKINDKSFTIEADGKEIDFKYKRYPESILEEISKALNYYDIYIINYKHCFFNEFQNENYFKIKEIEYLKSLIKIIINSKVFEELYSLYFDENTLPKQILKEDKIQNYIIDHISFFPYEEKEFKAQALTLIIMPI